ncbi:MAG: glycosyl hydrolase family 65 protein, partial [Bacteroidales bacterium]
YLADGDKEFMLDMLPDLEQDYKNWESDHRLPDGMYWQADVQDGMEESVSGGRRIKNARPTINSYMYGNALALSKMFSLSGDNQKSTLYAAKADTLKDLVQNNLWHPERKFFETRWVNGQLAQAREAIGYIPWYFNLPEQGKNYEEAWLQVKDPEGFLAPYGLTTAERRHPEFRTRGVGKCEWDGAVWPFASSQTMTAMANVLNNYEQNYVDKATYYELMNLYVESQYHRGRPYIGEYLDEVTGYWLKGDQLRSRYYNHSTFADLIITGLMGLRPREDDILEINPLIPDEQWNWFCLDNLMYHGKNIAIVWDSTGKKFKKGQGLLIFCNGKKVAQAASLGKITVDISTY